MSSIRPCNSSVLVFLQEQPGRSGAASEFTVQQEFDFLHVCCHCQRTEDRNRNIRAPILSCQQDSSLIQAAGTSAVQQFVIIHIYWRLHTCQQEFHFVKTQCQRTANSRLEYKIVFPTLLLRNKLLHHFLFPF